MEAYSGHKSEERAHRCNVDFACPVESEKDTLLPIMAPSTRPNPSLMKKIATLQLTLAPLVPLPRGPPHPAFPKTLLAFHLLTEDELDSIAHYYHQSTPGPWTLLYPTSMNWDKDFLNSSKGVSDSSSEGCRPIEEDQGFLTHLVQIVAELKDVPVPDKANISYRVQRSPTIPDLNQYRTLSDLDRIGIKRRKVGKFIGLVGMETPAEEIAGRLQSNLERAIEKSQAELRRTEEMTLRRRKAV